MHVLFLLLLSAGAQSTSAGELTAYTAAGFSLVQGRGFELVFAGQDTRELISELLWDIPPVLFLHAEAARSLGERTTGSLSLSAALVSAAGEMTDTDFFPPGTDLSEYDYPWSDWSLSKVRVPAAYAADLRLSYRLREPFRIHGGVRYAYWEWKDRALEYIYSDGTGGYEYGSFDGEPMITYRQHLLIPYGGISYTAGSPSLRWELGVFISPAVWAFAVDHHLKTETMYEDLSLMGTFIGLETSLAAQLLARTEGALFMRAQIMPVSRGDTRITKKQQEPAVLRSRAGIGSSTISFGFTLRRYRL